MLSIDYELSVPGFRENEIDSETLVRAYRANLEIKVTNDGQMSLYKLNVRPVLELYVGQDKPILLSQFDAQTIDQIAPKTMMPLTFSITTNHPGLVAVAIHVTDAADNAVMAKRQNETAYQQLPVRWWFHVIDDISIETLKALKTLIAQKQRATGKPKIKSLKEVKK